MSCPVTDDDTKTLKDCMTVTSKDGHFYYKASPKDEVEPGTTCGLYLITDPERQIEIELLHVDVSCEDGGLISVNYNLTAEEINAH